MIGRVISCVLAATLCVAASFVSGAQAAEGHWVSVAKATATIVEEAEALAAAGKVDEAKRKVTEAYFGPFESDKMEAAMRMELGTKHTIMREKQFGDLRKLAGKGDMAGFAALAADLKSGLASDGQALDKAGIKPDVFAVNQ